MIKLSVKKNNQTIPIFNINNSNTKDLDKATYFPVFEFLSFEKSKNKEPITGSKINDDRIGKFISLKLKKLIMQKILIIS